MKRLVKKVSTLYLDYLQNCTNLPTATLLKMVRRICKITVTLDFIFRLMLCSYEDVSFNSICLNVLEGIKQFYLLMWFKKTRLETPFKVDNVKA